MAEKTITNPAGAWGLSADVDGQHVMWVQNNSGATRTAGDLVVIDVTGVLATTTTTANDKTVLGVVAPKTPSSMAVAGSGDTYAAGAQMPVIVKGPARINIGANAVAAGDPLTSSTTAAQAQTNVATITGAATNNAFWGSVIAIAMEASGSKDANNCVRAYINKC